MPQIIDIKYFFFKVNLLLQKHGGPIVLVILTTKHDGFRSLVLFLFKKARCPEFGLLPYLRTPHIIYPIRPLCDPIGHIPDTCEVLKKLTFYTSFSCICAVQTVILHYFYGKFT